MEVLVWPVLSYQCDLTTSNYNFMLMYKMNPRLIRLLNPAKKSFLLMTIIVLLLNMTVGLFIGKAFADGESYSYTNSEQIAVSNGDLLEPSSLVRHDAATQDYTGSFAVDYDPGWGLLTKNVQCYIDAKVTTSATDPSQGTLTVALPEPKLAIGETYTNCTDSKALEQFTNSSVTIDTTNFGVSLGPREIIVWSYTNNYQAPASTDELTLKQGGATIETATVSLRGGIVTNNSYEQHIFKVSAGSYTVCSREANLCKDVTVGANSPPSQVSLGFPITYDPAGLVKVNLEYTLNNPPEGAVIDPITIVLVQDGSVIQSAKTAPKTITFPSDPGLSPLNQVHFYDGVSFENVPSGDYKVCNQSQTNCVPVTKLDIKPAEVTLLLDGDEVFSVLDYYNSGFLAECIHQSTSIFGDMLCYVISIELDITDTISGVLESFLQVTPVATGSGSFYSLAWSGFRTLALIMLVLASLVIIFGQAFSIEAYLIKKTIPRIVFAALGVLLSLQFAALLVDLFNVLGAGVHDLVLQPFSGTGFGISGIAGAGASAIGVGAALLAGSYLASIGTAGAALILLIPVVVAFLLAWFTLIIRQVLITALIIISPVALVMWVLPNTEKYFKSWFSMFTKLLLIYPLIMLLLAAGEFFAYIVLNVGIPGLPEWLTAITAMIAIAAPLFLVPATLKAAGGILGKITGMVNDKNRGLIDRARNKGKDIADYRKKQKARERNYELGQMQPKGGNLRTRARRGFLRLATGNAGYGKKYNELHQAESTREAVSTEQKMQALQAEAERRSDATADFKLNNEVAQMAAQGKSAEEISTTLEDIVNTASQENDTSRVRAALKQLVTLRNVPQLEGAIESLVASGHGETAKRFINENFGTIDSYAGHISRSSIKDNSVQWGYKAIAEFNPEQLVGQKPIVIEKAINDAAARGASGDINQIINSYADSKTEKRVPKTVKYLDDLAKDGYVSRPGSQTGEKIKIDEASIQKISHALHPEASQQSNTPPPAPTPSAPPPPPPPPTPPPTPSAPPAPTIITPRSPNYSPPTSADLPKRNERDQS